MIAMAAGVQHQKLETVLKASLEEFAKLKNERVGPEELNRAKEHLIGHLFLSIETSDQLAFFYGAQEVMGTLILSPEETAQKIKAVTAEEIQRVARDIFQNNRLNLALIGPFKDKSFSDILKL